MDGVSSLQRVALPLAPAGAGLLAALAGLAVLVAPTGLLESVAVHSGIASVIAAAEPPLGLTARLAMTIMAAGGMFVFAWVLLDALGPGRAIMVPRAVAQPVAPAKRDGGRFALPAFDHAALFARFAALRERAFPPRAADGAEPREPVRATRDLGVPFDAVIAGARRARPAMLADVERPLPKDLDLPLAAFDPGAVPIVAAEPVPLVPALAKAKPQPEPEPALALTILAPPEPAAAATPEPAPVPEAGPASERSLAAVPTPPAERWEVVALPTPPVTRPPERTERASEATIQALLARLERGVAQRAADAPAERKTARPPHQPAPWPSLDDTLGELRALAARG